MEIRRAVSCDAETIMQITHAAIEAVYPIYYNGSCVEFFLNLHSLGNIKGSIENDSVFILEADGKPAATCAFNENHILRLFVLPEFQNMGYGSRLMDYAEKIIKGSYSDTYLEASLSGCIMYEKRGYKTVCHRAEKTNGGILVYEVMKKDFNPEV